MVVFLMLVVVVTLLIGAQMEQHIPVHPSVQLHFADISSTDELARHAQNMMTLPVPIAKCAALTVLFEESPPR